MIIGNMQIVIFDFNKFGVMDQLLPCSVPSLKFAFVSCLKTTNCKNIEVLMKLCYSSKNIYVGESFYNFYMPSRYIHSSNTKDSMNFIDFYIYKLQQHNHSQNHIYGQGRIQNLEVLNQNKSDLFICICYKSSLYMCI